MADTKKLRSDIQKLKKAIEAKGVSKTVKDKLQGQLDKAESELAASKKPAKAAKTKKASTPLSRLQSLVKKKKYSAYSKTGVDLKKDAGQPALPTGKRKSKSGKTYYEYRANRIDVKQPPKRYPKLEDGGMMAKGGKIEIGSEGMYRGGEAKVLKYDDKNKIYSIKYLNEDGEPKGNFVVVKKDAFEESFALFPKMADGGEMAKGGYVSKGELVWRKLSNVDRTNFLKENFTPEITPMSQNSLVGKDFNFLPKKVKIKLEAKYANVEDYASGGYMAKKGKLLDNFSDKIQEGDIVWDSGNKRYGIVLNTYDFKYGEIRLDSDGNQPEENLHKLGSEGDKGSKDKLIEALVAHKRLIVEYPDRYEKVNYADGGRILVGRFDENQLRNKEDKKAVEKAQKETGLKYVDTKIIKKGGKMILEVYLIPNEEYYKSSKFADGGETHLNISDDERMEIKNLKGLIEESMEAIESHEKLAEKSDDKETKSYHENKVKKHKEVLANRKSRLEQLTKRRMAEGGYMANGGRVKFSVDDIQVGDYVNFGQYGNFYVANTDFDALGGGSYFWVTKDKDKRNKSNAMGKTMHKSDAQYIIEKYSDAEEMSYGGYMADGGETEKMALGGATVSTQYEKIEGTDYELKIKVYYDKGGISYATYKQEPRGYYLSVSPVQREKRDGYTVESYMAFSGVKTLLLPVQRQSPKSAKQAEEIAEKMMPEIKTYITQKVKGQSGFMNQGGYMAEGGVITIEEDMYGRSAYIPYKGETFLAEWNTERPTKASTVISDRSFRRLDEDSSLYDHLLVTLLKAMHENKVRYAEEGGKLAKGGYMAEGGVMSTTHRLSK